MDIRKSAEPASRPLVIPPPRPDRPPLKANLFSVMQKSNTQLMPLFPRFHPGAMVPAGAILRGGPDKAYGHFFHHNSVDEVVVAFAAHECLLQTSQVFVGGRVHGVNSFMKNEKNPEAFAVLCITQRQAEAGPQSEAVSVACEKCRAELFRRDFDATPRPDGDELSHPFPSVALLPGLFAEYNDDPAQRTCRECGHVNAPFPVAAWGWDDYAGQSATAAEATRTLNAALGRAGL